MLKWNHTTTILSAYFVDGKCSSNCLKLWSISNNNGYDVLLRYFSNITASNSEIMLNLIWRLKPRTCYNVGELEKWGYLCDVAPHYETFKIYQIMFPI